MEFKTNSIDHCENCRFWTLAEHLESIAPGESIFRTRTKLVCARYPKYEETGPMQWCGEYQEGED